MTRRKKRSNAAKRGASDHFSGFKLAFLDSRAASYQQSIDSNFVGEFYNRVTRDFIAKYGEDKPFYNDPDEDSPDPNDNFIDDIDEGSLLKEEVDEKAAVYIKLWTVS